jgi:hypothetical protein
MVHPPRFLAYCKAIFIGGRAACPFSFPYHRILSTPHDNFSKLYTLSVTYPNLVCRLLDALQGRGFGSNGYAQIVNCSFRGRPESQKSPPVTSAEADHRRGTRTSKSKPGPPAHPKFNYKCRARRPGKSKPSQMLRHPPAKSLLAAQNSSTCTCYLSAVPSRRCHSEEAHYAVMRLLHGGACFL